MCEWNEVEPPAAADNAAPAEGRRTKRKKGTVAATAAAKRAEEAAAEAEAEAAAAAAPAEHQLSWRNAFDKKTQN